MRARQTATGNECTTPQQRTTPNNNRTKQPHHRTVTRKLDKLALYRVSPRVTSLPEDSSHETNGLDSLMKWMKLSERNSVLFGAAMLQAQAK